MSHAIRVERLSKRYRISQRQPGGYRTLRETLTDSVCTPFRRWSSKGSDPSIGARSDVWALKDVGFEVQPGEVVGIIGRNGAGKSTLLKILSRITEPTRGRAEFRGRVRSLLEVGTGFHPELTGRENILLNGAILGMTRREVLGKFDEIVDFAGVDDFIDTPVKRYSSGMYVRLAFAVAAHLTTEILLVDEVLAVGDAAFQRKCLRRIGDVSANGGTILLVSHQLAAVQHLCRRALLLNHGQLLFDGPPQRAISAYMELFNELVEQESLRDRTDRSGTGKVRLTGFHVENAGGERVPAIQSGENMYIVLSYEASVTATNVDVGISLHDETDRTFTVFYSSYANQTFNALGPRGQFRCLIPTFPFTPGRYKVGARVVENGSEADWPKDGVGFIDVEAGDFYRSGRQVPYSMPMAMIDGTWSVAGA